MFFFRDCIFLRNSIADIFLILALYAYTCKDLKYKNIYFTIGILLASSIHVSFIFYLILLISNSIKISYKWILFVSLIMAYGAHTILGVVVSSDLFSNNIGFQNKYNDYMESSAWFTPIMATISLLLNYTLVKKTLMLNKTEKNSREHYRIQSLLNISNILFIVILFSSISMVVMRYFYNYFMFAYPFLFNRLYCDGFFNRRKLLEARIIFWCVVIWVFLWIVCLSNVNMNIPIILNNNSF